MAGLTCPKCGSSKIQAVTLKGRGYSDGLGALGCLFFGLPGLLLGLLGGTPDRVQYICMSCGHEFQQREGLGWLLAIVLVGGIVLILLLALSTG